MCNITKCWQEAWSISAEDHAIIPMKELVAGRYYDPLVCQGRKFLGQRSG